MDKIKRLLTACTRPGTDDRDASTSQPRPSRPQPPHPSGLTPRNPPGLPAPRPPRLPIQGLPRQLPPETVELFEGLVARADQVLARFNGPIEALAPDLRSVRLDMSRAMVNVAEEDNFSQRQKNLVYAQMLRGTSMTMSAARAIGMPEADRFVLEALLLTGQHHNRWVSHVGGDSDDIPEHRHMPRGQGFVGKVSFNPRTLFTTADINDLNGQGGATVAHESVHEAQFNCRSWNDSHDFHDAEASFDTSQHDLALQLELARRLPDLRGRVGEKEWAFHAAYQTNPHELQSYLEEQVASDLVPRDTRGIDLPPLRAESGLTAMPLLLAEAGHVLNSQFFREDNEVTLRNPRIAPLMERVVFDIAELADRAHSQAHDPARAARLAQELDSLLNLPAPRSNDEGIARLERMSQALQIAVADAEQAGPLRHVRATTPVLEPRARAASFNEAKNAPTLALVRSLKKAGIGYGFNQAEAPEARRIAKLFKSARHKSGFVDAVRKLQSPPGVLPAPNDIRGAVVRLAARLMGLTPADVPDTLLPAVHLYPAPAMEFERVPGLNAPPRSPTFEATPSPTWRESSHQKRKAQFDAVTWQLHVPQHLFLEEEADRLQARLAGLAFDLAYTTTTLLVQAEEAGFNRMDDPRHRRRAGIMKAMPVSNTADVMEVLGHHDREKELPRSDGSMSEAGRVLQKQIRKHLDINPQGVAGLMRVVARATPVRNEHVRWHEGPRAGLKAEARGGSQESGAAYETRTMDRWEQTIVGLRRAVIGPRAASAAAETSGA